MVVALKPERVRPVDHAAHRARQNHWKGRVDPERGPSEDALAMQCSILNHLTEFSPVTRAELEEDVAYDFGSFDVRAMHRNIAKLIKYGWVAKEEEYDLRTGAMTPVYRRLRRDDPPSMRTKPRSAPVEPLNPDPVGPWPGFRVLMVSERYSPRPMGPVSIKRLRARFPGGYFRPSEDTLRRKPRASRAKRSGQNP